MAEALSGDTSLTASMRNPRAALVTADDPSSSSQSALDALIVANSLAAGPGPSESSALVAGAGPSSNAKGGEFDEMLAAVELAEAVAEISPAGLEQLLNHLCWAHVDFDGNILRHSRPFSEALVGSLSLARRFNRR